MKALIEKQEGYSRRYNLIIEGLDEGLTEGPCALYEKVDSFIKNILGLSDIKFDITHRLGTKFPSKGHRTIVKFHCLTDKITVWAQREMLKSPENKEKGYRLIQDKPNGVKERESLAFKIVQTAQKSGNFRSAKFVGGKITIDGNAYEFEDLSTLPNELLPVNIYSPWSEKAIVFFTKHSI